MSRDKAFALCKLYVAIRDTDTGDTDLDARVRELRGDVMKKLIEEGSRVGATSQQLVQEYDKQQQARSLWN